MASYTYKMAADSITHNQPGCNLNGKSGTEGQILISFPYQIAQQWEGKEALDSGRYQSAVEFLLH